MEGVDHRAGEQNSILRSQVEEAPGELAKSSTSMFSSQIIEEFLMTPTLCKVPRPESIPLVRPSSGPSSYLEEEDINKDGNYTDWAGICAEEEGSIGSFLDSHDPTLLHSGDYMRQTTQECFCFMHSDHQMPCNSSIPVHQMAKFLQAIGNELLNGRGWCSTCGIHSVIDPVTKGNSMMIVHHELERCNSAMVGTPKLVMHHNPLNPALYSESLLVLSEELSNGSLGKKDLSACIAVLLLIASDLLSLQS